MAEYINNSKKFTICDTCARNTEEEPDIEWWTLRKNGGAGDFCSEKCVVRR